MFYNQQCSYVRFPGYILTSKTIFLSSLIISKVCFLIFVLNLCTVLFSPNHACQALLHHCSGIFCFWFVSGLSLYVLYIFPHSQITAVFTHGYKCEHTSNALALFSYNTTPSVNRNEDHFNVTPKWSHFLSSVWPLYHHS